MHNTNTPRVSVIVPFLNGSDWLIEALESVRLQTYANLEIIVMDDGSDPAHSQAARSYCLQYAGKILYADHPRHENKGVTISRNMAIELSTGSFIALLDADDRWMPDKISRQMHLFQQHPEAQLICEGSKFWYSWNDHTAEDMNIAIGASPDRLYAPGQLMKELYPLSTGASACPSGIIFRKKAFDRIGGFEPAFSGIYQLYEDQAFLAKFYLKEIVYVSGEVNNWYRKRTDSMSSAVNDKVCYEKVRKFYLNWLESYLNLHHINDKEINVLVQNAWLEMNVKLNQV